MERLSFITSYRNRSQGGLTPRHWRSGREGRGGGGSEHPCLMRKHWNMKRKKPHVDVDSNAKELSYFLNYFVLGKVMFFGLGKLCPYLYTVSRGIQ